MYMKFNIIPFLNNERKYPRYLDALYGQLVYIKQLSISNINENRGFVLCSYINKDINSGFVEEEKIFTDRDHVYKIGKSIINVKELINDFNEESMTFNLPDPIFNAIFLSEKHYNISFISEQREVYLDRHIATVDYFILVDEFGRPANLDVDIVDGIFVEKKDKLDLQIHPPINNPRIDWDEYFMTIASLSALRSKDPKTKVGACIVDNDNKILSIGYNGFPIGCSDQQFPWNSEASHELDKKDFYVVHAELNAILNYSGTSLKNSKIYVSLFPCCECAKAIIQSGIKEVIFKEDKDSNKTKAAKLMFDASGVNYRQYKPSGKELRFSI